MKRFTHHVLVLILLLAAACGGSQENNTDTLLDEVMAVHDEIMPKLSDMSKLRKQLKGQIDELVSQDSVGNMELIQQFQQGIEELDNSHEGMMNWMREFDNDFEGQTTEQILKYLNDQKGRIEEVGVKTNRAIKQAQDLLTK